MIAIKQILFPLIAIAFVVLFPHSGIIPLPFGYSIPVLIFIWLYLKLFKENFTTIGFSFKLFEIKTVLIGTVTAVLLFSFLYLVFFPLLDKIINLPAPDLGDIARIRGNPGFFIFILAMGWLVGGFYEEIVFHGFIFTRLEKLIPGKYTLVISFLLCNTIFALYHLQLGNHGVINAFLAGCIYHASMLRYKRNMWYAIFCHAVFDTIALTYIYAGYQ
jgi:membrane protease YdiL (CAAX protease family)